MAELREVARLKFWGTLFLEHVVCISCQIPKQKKLITFVSLERPCLRAFTKKKKKKKDCLLKGVGAGLSLEFSNHRNWPIVNP